MMGGRWFVLVVQALVVGGLGGRVAATARGAEPDVSAVALERLALRTEDGGRLPAAERAARARRLAELEERAGNLDLAGQAARAYLETVAVDAAVQALAGGAAGPAALERVREAARFAVGVGHRTHGSDLVLEALAWAPEEMPAHRAALESALLRERYAQVAPPLDALVALLGGQPAWRAFLADSPLGREAPSGQPPDTALGGLGALGAQMLDRRLTEALADKDLARARRLARQLLADDGWNLRARVLGHLLDEVEARRVNLAPAEVAAAVAPGSAGGGPVVVRLTGARAARKDAHGVTLALAFRTLQARLFEDARRRAAEVAGAAGVTEDQRKTAAAITAMAALEAGQHEAYWRWAEPAGADRSWWCTEEVLKRLFPGRRKGAAERPAERAALRQVFRQPLGPANAELQLRWAREAALSGEAPLAATATALLRQSEPAAARVLERCRAPRAGAPPCREQLEALEQIQGAEEDGLEDPLAVLGKVGEVPPTWLANMVPPEAAKLPAYAAYLDGLPLDRYGGTPGFVAARLGAHVAAGQVARAQAFFARWGAVLGRGERIAARLALDDLRRKRLSPSQAAAELGDIMAAASLIGAAPDSTIPGGGDDDDGDDDEGVGEGDGEAKPGAAARLRQVLYAAGPRAAEARLRALDKVWRRLGGIEGAELAAHRVVAAKAAKRARAAEEARRAVIKLAPQGELAALLEAERAAAGGDHRTALAHAARAVVLLPSPAVANQFAERWLAAATAPALDAEQRSWLRRLATGLRFTVFARLDRALERRLATSTPDLRKVAVAARGGLDAELELWPDVGRDGVFPEWRLQVRLGELAPAATPAFARRVIAYLDRATPPAQARALRAWSHFIAGDGAAALRAADAAPARRGAPATLVRDEIGPHDPLRLLARLGDPGDAAFRQRMFKLFHRSPGSDDHPRLLWARAAERPADAALLRELACRAAEQLGRARQALSLCGQGWAQGVRTPGVAAALASFLAADPDAARLEAVDGERFFSEARKLLLPQPPASVLHHQAQWLAKLDRHAEAAAAEAAAWAAGYTADRFEMEVEAWGWVKHQPLLARQHVGATIYMAGERNLVLATLGLVAADLGVAAAHAQAISADDLETLDPERRLWAQMLPDLVAVAAADLAEKRLPAEVLADLGYALVRGKVEPAIPAVLRDHPRSYLAAVLELESSLVRLQVGEGAARARALAARFPTNVMVVRLQIVALMLGKRLDDARAALARLRAARPADARLDGIIIPGIGPGGDGKGSAPAPGRPVWAGSALAWAEALAQASPQPLLDDAADKLAHLEDAEAALEAFLPSSFVVDPSQPFTFARGSLRLTARRAPRVTHCAPASCLAEIAAALAPSGFTQLWSRPVRLPAGEAAEALFEVPTGYLSMMALPIGAHVFLLSAGGPSGELQAGLPALRLFRDTFRPQDLVFERSRAEFLRGQGGADWLEPVPRARGRLLPAGTGRGATAATCALDGKLRALGAQQRAGLLVDLYLTTASAEDRQRLLACVAATSEHAAILGLAALWDGNEEALAFGKAATARNAARVVRAVQGGLEAGAEDKAAAAASDDRRTPAGLLQVLLALPARQRSALALRFFDSGDPRLRGLALASLRWMADALPVARQADLLAGGPDGDARLLAAALPHPLPAALVASARARLERLTAGSPAGERELAELLVPRLAAGLDPADGSRLEKLRALLERPGGRAGGKGAADGEVSRSIEAHALGSRGADLAAAAPAVRALVERWRAAATGPPRARAARADWTLGETPLGSRPLPAGWSYMRIGQPGTFLAGVEDLGRRLLGSRDPRVVAGERLLAHGISSSVGDRFAESGLDLDSPFECAVSFAVRGRSFVCSAVVRDDRALRRRLGEVASPRAVGVALPWHVGMTATVMPTLTAFLPFALANPEPRRSRAAAGAPLVPPVSPAERLFSERVDDQVVIGGQRLSRRAQVVVERGRRAEVDEALWLIAGRRFWLFSDPDSAEAWRRDAVAAGETPQRLLGGPGAKDGAAMRALLVVDERDGGTREPVRLELAPASNGLRVRAHVRGAPVATGAGTAEVLGLLPPGSAATFTTPVVPGPPFWGFHGDLPGLLGEQAAAPPLWLWRASRAIALGWYPRGGDRPSARWVSAIPWNAQVEKVWTAEGLPPPGPTSATAKGLTFVRRGGALVVGPDRALVDTPPAARPAAAAGGAELFQVRLEGAAVRDAMDGLAAAARTGDPSGEVWRGWATVASLVSGVDMRGVQEGASFRLEAFFRTPEGGGAAPDASVVGEWLRSVPLRNSLTLPRPLGRAEGARPITFTIKSARAEDLRRAFPPSARLSLETPGSGPFRMLVRPPAPGGRRAALAEGERGFFLQPEMGALPAPVQAAAREVVGRRAAAGERAEAIVRWVHQQMTYEITPTILDDLTVLGRKRGDCTEYSQLTVALMRAVGIPARVRSGFMADHSTLVAHAWVEFHDGQAWREADPTAGTTSVSAAYIEASVLDVLALVSAGQIEIVGVD